MLLTRGRHGYICVNRGGSGTTTKTRKNRLVPIHAKLRAMIDMHPHVGERVLYASQLSRSWGPTKPLNERLLLSRLKQECARCGFESAATFKLHTFRHAFASMCARANVSFKYALAWMGHQNSEVLDLYYRMFDATADAAMETIRYEPSEQLPVSGENDYQI